jgi:RNA 3'-terminal phosphate cyclase-like protein
MPVTQPPLRFTGHHSLSHRLVLSTLTGRAIHISQIRPSSPSNPGLAPHEISLLRLLESVTNGAHIEISYTGTILLYKPGLVSGTPSGTSVLRHEIAATCSRGVSYFLMPLALLAPFSKAPFNVLLTGPGAITSSTPSGDMSVDSVRTAILPLYAKFGIDRNIELRILQRSNVGQRGKGGAGEVQLVFHHQVRLPKTLHFMNCGRIKRIRGVAYSTGVSGSNNARMIDAARGILNPFATDTYIFSDVTSAALVPAPEKNSSAAKRKIGLGFGLSLVAESSTGALYSADAASPSAGGQPPEDVGQECAYHLLESIARGGCASLEAAPTMITLMAMGSEDIGRIQLGKDVLGNENIIQLARDLSKFGAAGWGIRDPDENSEREAVVSIIGRGIGNVGRKIG